MKKHRRMTEKQKSILLSVIGIFIPDLLDDYHSDPPAGRDFYESNFFPEKLFSGSIQNRST